jgi:hypothetical protein
MGAKPLVHPTSKLYDEDFAQWTAETARLLREGRFKEIDVEHVAEEIEDMGKNHHREVSSRLRLIIQHLLKWQYQPDRRSGSWKAKVATQREELEELLEQSPSLRRTPDRTLVRAYGVAVVAAASETWLPEDSFPPKCPYTLEQIQDRDFLPGQ